jgi:hypothetical protein
MKTIAFLLTAGLLVWALNIAHPPTVEFVTVVPKSRPVLPVQSEPEPYIDEQCQGSPACNGDEVVWELVMIPSGDVVSFGDMDEQECEEMKSMVEEQTEMEAFTGLKCRPRWVERENI